MGEGNGGLGHLLEDAQEPRSGPTRKTSYARAMLGIIVLAAAVVILFAAAGFVIHGIYDCLGIGWRVWENMGE